MVTLTITNYKRVCVCRGIGGTIQCITRPCIDAVCMPDNIFIEMQDELQSKTSPPKNMSAKGQYICPKLR